MYDFWTPIIFEENSQRTKTYIVELLSNYSNYNSPWQRHTLRKALSDAKHHSTDETRTSPYDYNLPPPNLIIFVAGRHNEIDASGYFLTGFVQPIPVYASTSGREAPDKAPIYG